MALEQVYIKYAPFSIPLKGKQTKKEILTALKNKSNST